MLFYEPDGGLNRGILYRRLAFGFQDVSGYFEEVQQQLMDHGAGFHLIQKVVGTGLAVQDGKHVIIGVGQRIYMKYTGAVADIVVEELGAGPADDHVDVLAAFFSYKMERRVAGGKDDIIVCDQNLCPVFDKHHIGQAVEKHIV